jgi:type I restriction enzyme R subunit
LEDVIVGTGFDKIAAINRAIEVINQSEETRKRFEILAREIFKKFKACLTIRKVNEYRALHNAVDIIYKKLQEHREKANITGIIREMHQIVDEAIEPDMAATPDDKDKTYDISKINFDRLKEEFRKYSKKNTTMQNLKYQVEKRLQQMIEKNPLRTDFYRRYQEIIEDYNREKDRITIEETFVALLKFVEELDNEEKRAIQEGLDEETLALFDLLLKSDITPRDRNKLKTVTKDLLGTLKKEKLRVHNWREKEATKAEVKTFIRDFLWNEKTGLPIDSFTEDEVDLKADIVFDHIFKQYADAYHHAYAA